MSKSRFRIVIGTIFVLMVGTFTLGMYYGREVVRLVAGVFYASQGAADSWFAHKGSNNSKILVFIHGVTGTPRETWTHSEGGLKVFWPDIIKSDDRFKDYDIFMLSYFTPLLESGPSIGQIAETMYKDLERNLILPERSQMTVEKNRKANYEKLKYKEVVFVAHSMGNLIIRNMMVSNRLPDDSPVHIPLILSLASPSGGSELAAIGEKLSINETYSEMIKREKNSFLQLLDTVWRQSAFDTEIACAYEEKADPRLGKKVVEKDSATAMCTRKDPRGLPEDHITIVKPKKRDDPIHSWVVEEINKPRKKQQWVEDRWESNEVVVGGKDYAESNIHAAMIVLLLRDLGMKVTFKYELGHASRVFTALVNKEVDILPEYDGSILYEYLRKPLNVGDSGAGNAKFAGDLEHVNNELQKGSQTVNMRYLPHFGFNNPYVFVMLRSEAERLRLIQKDGRLTLSSLREKAPTDLVLVSDQEFFYRNEWSVLRSAYGLSFAAQPPTRHDEIYNRVREGRADKKAVVGVGYGTDSDLYPFPADLIIIEDDLKVLPPYYAAPLVNRLLLRKFPQIEAALSKLGKVLTLEEMVDLLKKHKALAARTEGGQGPVWAVETVAREFLESKGILKKVP